MRADDPNVKLAVSVLSVAQGTVQYPVLESERRQGSESCKLTAEPNAIATYKVQLPGQSSRMLWLPR